MKKIVSLITIATLALGASLAFAQDDREDDDQEITEVQSILGDSLSVGTGADASISNGDDESDDDMLRKDDEEEDDNEKKEHEDESDDDGAIMNIKSNDVESATPVLLQADGSTEEGVEVQYEGGNAPGTVTDIDGDGAIDVVVEKLHINGVEVRGWDQGKKEAILARVQVSGESTTVNDLGLRVAAATIEHEDILSIDTNEQETDVAYIAKIKLFGFIPKMVVVNAKAQTDGTVTVEYPWYAFLAAKGDQTIYNSLALELRSRHDVAMSAVRNMK